MSKSLFCLLALCFSVALSSRANYTTPGTNVRYDLADLVANAGGDVTFSDAYFVNDTITISVGDTLAITSDATVKFAAGTFFEILGTIIVEPPSGVLFTAQNITTGYLGMRLTASPASRLKKLTFEYAVSLRLTDCGISIDSCTFQYNNNSSSTTFGNGAIALFRSNSIITNSRFSHNQRAAIQGGANISNAPRIVNCLFMNNNTTNQNVPQINLGATGTDTARIINNQILRASTRSGGIGFLPVGDAHVVISGNMIKNNRYGITLNGGANIRSLISYNVIDSNNTEGNPITGGSGISFSGGSATSHQASVVTGNYIRWNLWGITVSPTSTGGGAMPNLGNLLNADTSDNGKNWIYGNTNTSTPNINLYNNNVDDLMAQNNYWGSDDPNVVEGSIFHRVDNASLGLVNYSDFITLPIELVAFTAVVRNNRTTLSWRTSMERNSQYFQVERGTDGYSFQTIGKVDAAGYSSTERDYHFNDQQAPVVKQYYRLKLVDQDRRFRYTNVIVLLPGNEGVSPVKVYPTIFTASQSLTAIITSSTAQMISVQFLSADGRLLQKVTRQVAAGANTLTIEPNLSLPAGVIRVWFRGEGLDRSIGIIKQ